MRSSFFQMCIKNAGKSRIDNFKKIKGNTGVNCLNQL